jgi:predicted ATPase/class 3 adenylate cyclase
MDQTMNSFPSGTVTFLFTDIEGSTKLAQEYPDEMPALLTRHHEILNQSIQAHRGYVFQIVGDAFCAAFHTASEALNAALDAQRLLHSETWSPAPIKVRMGIHTGTAQLREGDAQEGKYSGYATLATVQRVMSAGHGGQILLSQSTHDLVKDILPERAELRDMGERHLKSILQPNRLFQLAVPDLPSEFAPLNTLESFNHNLPAQITSFIGRQKELDEVKKLAAANRIVTLTGSGGSGKTRLGLQVGADCLGLFSHGVWLIELAPITDTGLVAQTLLTIFNLREDSHRTPLEILTAYLRPKNLMLILDNCEHLIEACAHISETLLHACPNLKILASSREVLGIAGEVSYHVPSLATPDLNHLPSTEKLLDVDSIRLFVERATAVKPGFELTKDNASFIAQTCSRLDGIPLAIELAAARARVLSPEQIASRLDDRFHLLTGGARTALPRQQTLRAMIDWSYSLLTEQEKTLFRRLAVFVGGWTLDAAESVCADVEQDGILPHDILDLLTRLVDKSLVTTEESMGVTRYHRLETIRQYSREKFLETDEVESIRGWHLSFFVRFSEQADENLQGRDQLLWGNRMAMEQGNLRAALEWGLSKNPYSALRIAGASNLFWTAGGFSAEGFRWTQKALEQAEKSPTPQGITPEAQLTARAKALRGLTRLYLSLGENVNAKRAAEESVALYRQSDDRRGLAFALVILAYPLEFLGERVRAETLLLESNSIARAEGAAYLICRSLNILARVTIDLHHDLELAKRYVGEAYLLARTEGLRYQEAQSLEILGFAATDTKDYAEARLYFLESARIYQEVGAAFNVILEKSNYAHLERQTGNYASALETYRETILAFRDIGQTGAIAHQLECFAFIALAQDQKKRALQLLAAANAIREKANIRMRPEEQVYYNQQLKKLHDKMDSPTLEWIWSKGHALSMEQAVTLAVEETHE